MRDHKQLRAFILADETALQVYRITKNFPQEELYGLKSQMRRAAIFVASNIVEGCARESQSEYHRFLEIAFGSLRELSYQLSISIRLGFIDERECSKCKQTLLDAEKTLGALVRSQRQNIRKTIHTNLQPTNLQPTNLQPTNLQPTNLQPTNLQPTNLQPTASPS